MNTTPKQYRQGDVLIEAVERLPVNAHQFSSGPRIILAHGEATGHHHSIDATAADWWKSYSGEQFIQVQRVTALEHQEHAPIELPPGRYRVVQQREYVPGIFRATKAIPARATTRPVRD